MKKKMVLGIAAALLLLQAQTVFAADTYSDFEAAIREGNLSKAERILKNNAKKWSIDEQGKAWLFTVFDEQFSSSRSLQAAQLLYQYNVDWDDWSINTALHSKKSEDLIRYLITIRMPFGRYCWAAITNGYGENFTRFLIDKGAPIDSLIYAAIEKGYSDNFFQFLLDKGVKISSQNLQKAAQNKRWSLVSLMVTRLSEDDMSYRYTRADATTDYNSQSAAYRSRNSFDYDPNDSKTALMYAAQSGQLRIVRLLVEKGAKVNLRADDGATAASLAYDNGEIEIYNYLKAHGAIDFEPRQVTQQPVTPAPAPAQSSSNYTPPPSSSSGSSSQSQSSGSSGADVAARVASDINSAFQSPLENGRYRISGRPEEISFAGIAKSGMVYYKDAAGTQNKGTYSIDGDRLTINVMNRSYIYSITSKTSFSGNGEAWYRVGF
ncbi:hypothetical protein R84B8_02305 [Treponema sp. R8-4-B8]